MAAVLVRRLLAEMQCAAGSRFGFQTIFAVVFTVKSKDRHRCCSVLRDSSRFQKPLKWVEFSL